MSHDVTSGHAPATGHDDHGGSESSGLGKKIIIAVLLASVLVGVFLWWSSRRARNDEAVNRGGPVKITDVRVEWPQKDLGTDETGRPKTELSVRIIARFSNGEMIAPTRILGAVDGGCFEIPQPKEDEATAAMLGYMQCFWAGAGSQYAAFRDGDDVIIKRRSLAEEDQKLKPLQEVMRIGLVARN